MWKKGIYRLKIIFITLLSLMQVMLMSGFVVFNHHCNTSNTSSYWFTPDVHCEHEVLAHTAEHCCDDHTNHQANTTEDHALNCCTTNSIIFKLQLDYVSLQLNDLILQPVSLAILPHNVALNNLTDNNNYPLFLKNQNSDPPRISGKTLHIQTHSLKYHC